MDWYFANSNELKSQRMQVDSKLLKKYANSNEEIFVNGGFPTLEEQQILMRFNEIALEQDLQTINANLCLFSRVFYIFKRYYLTKSVMTDKLEIVRGTCMLVASKWSSLENLKKFVKSNIFCRNMEEIVKMEGKVMLAISEDTQIECIFCAAHKIIRQLTAAEIEFNETLLRHQLVIELKKQFLTDTVLLFQQEDITAAAVYLAANQLDMKNVAVYVANNYHISAASDVCRIMHSSVAINSTALEAAIQKHSQMQMIVAACRMKKIKLLRQNEEQRRKQMSENFVEQQHLMNGA